MSPTLRLDNIFGVNRPIGHMQPILNMKIQYIFLCYNYRHGRNTFGYNMNMITCVPEVIRGVKWAIFPFTPKKFSVWPIFIHL